MGNFNKNDRDRPRTMYSAICSSCGKNCEVPFRPTGDKPVYCRDCFDKGGSGFGSRDNSISSKISQEQYRELNTKLDKILGILERIEFDDDKEEFSEDEKNSD